MCTFEKSELCGYIHDTETYSKQILFNWTRNSNETQFGRTLFTGPSTDKSGNVNGISTFVAKDLTRKN